MVQKPKQVGKNCFKVCNVARLHTKRCKYKQSHALLIRLDLSLKAFFEKINF